MDPLLALRRAIQSNASIFLSTSAELSDATKLADDEIVTAQYLHISGTSEALPLAAPTRYEANNKTTPTDLRAVYNAWLTRDLKVTDYITLSNERGILNLKTIDRADLLAWLKEPDAISENIRPVGETTEKAVSADDKLLLAQDTEDKDSSKAPSSAPKDTSARPQAGLSSTAKPSSTNPLDIVTPVEDVIPAAEPPRDPDVARIYELEHALVNRNSVLHGTKQIDFSHIARECREQIINVVMNAQKSSHGSRHHGSSRNGYGPAQPQYNRNGEPVLAARSGSGLLKGHHSSSSNGASSSYSSSSSSKKDPIILLSPSTSALLNMGNVKEFLERGEFVPQQSSIGASNLQYITRYSTRLAHNGGARPAGSAGKSSANGAPAGAAKIKFVIVDNVERFKPEYWDRVVAVFVTGQPWQFKTYKWNNPNELFQKVAGFYLAYAGERVPPALGTWRNITVATIPKNERFRDREAAELIWNSIEKWMLSKGWRY